MMTDPRASTTSTSNTEPDAELSELVENFEKMKQQQQQQRPHGPSPLATLEYVRGEVENLRKKQALVQEQIDAKTKEIHALRETLLVVNGALQGLEHIQEFMVDAESGSASVSSSSSKSKAL
jgi:hypothetical protein